MPPVHGRGKMIMRRRFGWTWAALSQLSKMIANLQLANTLCQAWKEPKPGLTLDFKLLLLTSYSHEGKGGPWEHQGGPLVLKLGSVRDGEGQVTSAAETSYTKTRALYLAGDVIYIVK